MFNSCIVHIFETLIFIIVNIIGSLDAKWNNYTSYNLTLVLSTCLIMIAPIVQYLPQQRRVKHTR